MAESFGKKDSILRDWLKIKYKTVLSKHCTDTRSRKSKKKAVSFLENDSEKILEQSQSAVERD